MFRSNPVNWSPEKVSEFILSQKEEEISQLAQAFKQEQVKSNRGSFHRERGDSGLFITLVSNVFIIFVGLRIMIVFFF